MGGMASGALFLASPLAALGQPATEPEPAAPAMFAAPARAFLIVDVPAQVGRRTLGELIADEAKRDAAGTPFTLDIGHSPDPALPDDAGGAGPASLEDAVVAAHDERIAFLTHRLHNLRSEGADAASLGALSGRLHRAQAARQLAMARAALDRQPAGCEACAPAPMGVAGRDAVRQPAAPALRLPSVAKVAERATKPQPRRQPATLAMGSARVPAMLTASKAGAQPAGLHPDITRPDGTDRPAAATASVHARRLLTAARRVLEADIAKDAPPPLHVAGLWQWDGSERWSLADYPNRSA